MEKNISQRLSLPLLSEEMSQKLIQITWITNCNGIKSLVEYMTTFILFFF